LSVHDTSLLLEHITSTYLPSPAQVLIDSLKAEALYAEVSLSSSSSVKVNHTTSNTNSGNSSIDTTSKDGRDSRTKDDHPSSQSSCEPRTSSTPSFTTQQQQPLQHHHQQSPLAYLTHASKLYHQYLPYIYPSGKQR